MPDITKYGIREVCDLKFYKLNPAGGKGDLVFTIDTAKTSTLEGAATTVYAQGGKGNPRLIAWEGEKTLTFTVEDALISKEGLELLTGNDVTEQDNVIDITVDKTAGYYYVEAESLMRKELDGEDYPLHIVLPRVKVQSNFSISMAPTGDPSTFSYVMDAFPGMVNGKRLLCQMTIEKNSLITGYTASFSGTSISIVATDGSTVKKERIGAVLISGDAVIEDITDNTIAVTKGETDSIVKVSIDGIEKYVIIK